MKQQQKDAIPVTGVWLRTRGDRIHVLVEYDGAWRLINDEHKDAAISHIVEPGGIRKSPVDR